MRDFHFPLYTWSVFSSGAVPARQTLLRRKKPLKYQNNHLLQYIKSNFFCEHDKVHYTKEDNKTSRDEHDHLCSTKWAHPNEGQICHPCLSISHPAFFLTRKGGIHAQILVLGCHEQEDLWVWLAISAFRSFFFFPWESLHKTLINTIFCVQLSQFQFPHA